MIWMIGNRISANASEEVDRIAKKELNKSHGSTGIPVATVGKMEVKRLRGSGDIGVHCLRGNGEPSRLRGAG